MPKASDDEPAAPPRSPSPPASPIVGIDLELLPADVKPTYLSRDEILSIQGHERVLLLAMCNGRWVPLEPDRKSKQHRLGGMVASGLAVRPARKLSPACCFRLEVPAKGDMTRVFLRSLRKAPDIDDDSPKYRKAPFLLFVNDVLCVRHLPAHAITPSNKRARSKSSWELLELRVPFTAGGGDEESAVAGTRPARADTVLADTLELASFQLHAGPTRRRVRYDVRKGNFVNTAKPSPNHNDTWFAFAKMDWQRLAQDAENEEEEDCDLASTRLSMDLGGDEGGDEAAPVRFTVKMPAEDGESERGAGAAGAEVAGAGAGAGAVSTSSAAAAAASATGGSISGGGGSGRLVEPSGGRASLDKAVAEAAVRPPFMTPLELLTLIASVLCSYFAFSSPLAASGTALALVMPNVLQRLRAPPRARPDGSADGTESDVP